MGFAYVDSKLAVSEKNPVFVSKSPIIAFKMLTKHFAVGYLYMVARLTGALVFALMLACSAQAQTTHENNLGQVPGALKTQADRQAFAQGIEGAPVPLKKTMGIPLPAGLSAKTLSELIVPRSDTLPLNMVGALAWPGHNDTYIVLVCTGGDNPQSSDGSYCGTEADIDSNNSYFDDPPLHVYVAAVTWENGSAPVLLAQPALVNPTANWNDTLLPETPDASEIYDPTAEDDTPQQIGSATAPQIDMVDLAPYQIAPGLQAFGLRGVWNDAYGGGFGEFHALFLFAIIDGKVQQVLSTPANVFCMYGGDWNPDGTRQHETSEGTNYFIVSSHKTNGYYDIIVHEMPSGHKRIFQWDMAAQRYILMKPHR